MKNAITSPFATVTSPFATVREYENAHIVLWLIKDTSWCLGLHWLGVAMILPTLAVAIDIARRSRHETAEFAHNVAVCFWICANIVWMTGEFFFNDSFRPGAMVFFGAGLMVLAWHYVFRPLSTSGRVPSLSRK